MSTTASGSKIQKLPGIHHVTAIASDPQRNVDFYTGVLGLRLVKVTINYDDPGSYHFYYGDEAGTPGTILTFFAWPGGHRGRRGTAQATTTAFSVPEGSLDYWQARLKAHDVPHEVPIKRLDEGLNERALLLYDPDGLQLELVAHRDAPTAPGWEGSTVEADAAIRGFHSVALTLKATDRTAELLTDTMGFRQTAESADRRRYEADSEAGARRVDLLLQPGVAQGSVAVGNVHHVAWRTPTDDQQQEWLAELSQQRRQVSPIMDRQYFHSIYFREPGGVLFEIATDTPGFTTDEPLDRLGTHLCLPDWLEKHRPQIELALPVLRYPKQVSTE